MLRPATTDALSRLRVASCGSDRELDRALSDVGVLPPLDLDPIRRVIGRPGTTLATTRNADGHVVITVLWSDTRSVMIHHDGRVHQFTSAAA